MSEIIYHVIWDGKLLIHADKLKREEVCYYVYKYMGLLLNQFTLTSTNNSFFCVYQLVEAPNVPNTIWSELSSRTLKNDWILINGVVLRI